VPERDLGHLARQRGGCLLPPAVPRAERTVDVVVAGNAGLEAVVLEEVTGHPLGEELLPAIAVLGIGRVGIRLGKRRDVRIGLLLPVVDARRAAVEEALRAGVACGDQHVGAGEH
jgi:hypothetical protein